MFASPPHINSLIINSLNPEALHDFYVDFGIAFCKGINNYGLEKYFYNYDGFVFEINLVKDALLCTKNLKIRFVVYDIHGYCDIINEIGIEIINKIETDSSCLVTIKDPDGNIIELYEEF